jgi:outer membrane lipase/esterase
MISIFIYTNENNILIIIKGDSAMFVRSILLRLTPLFSVLILCATWANAQSTEYDSATFFGDSLSDPGNKYALTGLKNTPPYDQLDPFLIPDGPYAIGGLHHSNGQTWTEQLAKHLGLGDYAKPAYHSRGKASNYSYGGARAGNPLVIPPCTQASSNLHLSDQVNSYLSDVNGDASTQALYALFIGGNDVADAVRVLPCFGGDPTTSIFYIATNVLPSLEQAIVDLYEAGGRIFLVGNSPDLGQTPAFNLPLNQFPGASDAATCFSLLYNFGTLSNNWVSNQCGFPPGLGGIVDILAGLQAQYPDIKFIQYDLFSKVRQLVLAPIEGEPQNGLMTCVMPEVPPFSCKNPDNHVFWDGIHPTKAVHNIVADEIIMLLMQ